jgi:hypothetical protein
MVEFSHSNKVSMYTESVEPRFPASQEAIFACVAAALLAMLLMALREAVSEYRLPVVILSYTITVLLLYLLVAPALFLAPKLYSHRDAWVGFAILAVLILPIADPYSTGRIGGDANAQPVHYWQLWMTALSPLMIIVVGILFRFSYWKVGFYVTVVETISFIVCNVIYVSRDGDLRFYDGYEGYPTPLLVTLGALSARLWLVRAAWKRKKFGSVHSMEVRPAKCES